MSGRIPSDSFIIAAGQAAFIGISLESDENSWPAAESLCGRGQQEDGRRRENYSYQDNRRRIGIQKLRRETA